MTKIKKFFKNFFAILNQMAINSILLPCFGSVGKKLTDEEIEELYRLVDEDDYVKPKKRRSFKK